MLPRFFRGEVLLELSSPSSIKSYSGDAKDSLRASGEDHCPPPYFLGLVTIGNVQGIDM